MRAVVCVLALVASAAAETPTERADALFKRGKELMAGKRYAEACKAFDRSYEAEASVSTLLNRADCREKNNQLATAWRLFKEAATKARDDAPGKQMKATATARAEDLESRLSRLTIRIGDNRPAGFKLSLGEQALETDGTFEEFVDGGTYTIRASEPGLPEWTTTVEIEPQGDDEVIDVPEFERTTGKPIVKPRSTETKPRQPSLPPPSKPSKLGAKVAIGVGITLAGAAIGSYFWGEGAYDRALREPDNVRQEELWNLANNRRYLAQGLAIGAAASITIGVVLLVRGRSPEPVKTAIVPTASAGEVGVGLLHRW